MSRHVTEGELRGFRRASTLALLLCLAVGIGSFALAFAIEHTSRKNIEGEIALFIGVTLAQAALVGLLLNRVSVREQALAAQKLVDESLDAALMPLRPTLHRGAQSNYTWTAVLSPPHEGDQWPDYATVTIAITREVDAVPSQYRVIGAAALDETPIADALVDPRFLVRWIVRPELDMRSDAAFSVLSVAIDGVELKPTWKRTREVAEARFPVPRNLRGEGRTHVVHCTYQVRKRVSADRRVTFRTQLTETTLGAEFVFVCDSRLELASLAAYHTEVTPLSGAAAPVGRLRATGDGPWLVSVRYAGALQRGSSVSFELERE